MLDGGAPAIDAAGKDVVVIGGGDTGNDCLGTAVRQGARSVRQFEFLCPPRHRSARPRRRVAAVAQRQEDRLWPDRRPSSSWVARCASGAIDTLEVLRGEDGCRERALRVVDLDWSHGKPERVEGSEREVPAQLVLIACGFTGPEKSVFDAFGVEPGPKGRPLPVMATPASHRAAASIGATPVFAAGDARNGSSLVVSAMADALACAAEVASTLKL